MIRILNNSIDPFYNLALEEYFLKHRCLDCIMFILWQNCPTVVIGKNQNCFEEINEQYVKEHKINVVRRLSGGGAVYHDLGNLNFTFIQHDYDPRKHDFPFFAAPIINCLDGLGIKAEFSGRNDITVNNKKISGNAQYYHEGAVLHHGTLLFDSDLTILGKALNVQKKEHIYSTQAIPSHKSEVTNIVDYLNKDFKLCRFNKLLTQSIFAHHQQPYRQYVPTEEERHRICELMEKRYKAWKWTFGDSPDFNCRSKLAFAGGTVALNFIIKKGIIIACKISGDFFDLKSTEELENIFRGQKYDQEILLKLIKHKDISKYIKNLSTEEFSKLLTQCNSRAAG